MSCATIRELEPRTFHILTMITPDGMNSSYGYIWINSNLSWFLYQKGMGCMQSPGIRKKGLLFRNAPVKNPGDGTLIGF